MSFVFTNQVNGKLAPIESAVSPRLQQEESSKELLKPNQNVKPNFITTLHRKSSLQSVSAVAIKSSYSPKPSVTPATNSDRYNQNISTHAALKTQNTLVNQLPQKRSCPVYVDDDDDLE